MRATSAHKRTVDLKKRSKASRLPGFSGEAIARATIVSGGELYMALKTSAIDSVGRTIPAFDTGFGFQDCQILR